MKKKNCLYCLYANYSEIAMMIEEATDSEHRKCEHQNSAYFNELVGVNDICRLFLDEKEYFRNKDLINKIEKIRSNKIKR